MTHSDNGIFAGRYPHLPPKAATILKVCSSGYKNLSKISPGPRFQFRPKSGGCRTTWQGMAWGPIPIKADERVCHECRIGYRRQVTFISFSFHRVSKSPFKEKNRGRPEKLPSHQSSILPFVHTLPSLSSAAKTNRQPIKSPPPAHSSHQTPQPAPAAGPNTHPPRLPPRYTSDRTSPAGYRAGRTRLESSPPHILGSGYIERSSRIRCWCSRRSRCRWILCMRWRGGRRRRGLRRGGCRKHMRHSTLMGLGWWWW